MTTFSFGPTVNPGRFRKQKAAVKERALVVRHVHDQRRQLAAEEERAIALNRACIQDAICGIKAVLQFEIRPEELPKWPVYPPHIHKTPKTFTKECLETAMKYFDSKMTLDRFNHEFYSIDRFWFLEQWINERLSAVDTIDFDGPWYNVPTRAFSNYTTPRMEASDYFFDPILVDASGAKWHDWRLRTVAELQAMALKAAQEDPLPPAWMDTKVSAEDKEFDLAMSHAVTRAAEITTGQTILPEPEPLWAEDTEGRTALDQAYQAMFNDPKLLLAMADKNQGYVHGEMWWNVPGKLIRKLFQRRTK